MGLFEVHEVALRKISTSCPPVLYRYLQPCCRVFGTPVWPLASVGPIPGSLPRKSWPPRTFVLLDYLIFVFVAKPERVWLVVGVHMERHETVLVLYLCICCIRRIGAPLKTMSRRTITST